MAIYRLISNGSFGPDEIKVMTAAYEAALRAGALLTRITNAHELATPMSLQARCTTGCLFFHKQVCAQSIIRK